MFAFAESAEARKAGARAAGSGLEVMIHDNGRVLVRGAEVTDIDGSVITSRTEWGAGALTWTVRTGDADFVRKDGTGIDRDDIADGDYISFSGTLDEDAAAFAVDADVVKNWSLDDSADREEDLRAKIEARIEARADDAGRWNGWLKSLPVLGWLNSR